MCVNIKQLSDLTLKFLALLGSPFKFCLDYYASGVFAVFLTNSTSSARALGGSVFTTRGVPWVSVRPSRKGLAVSSDEDRRGTGGPRSRTSVLPTSFPL